MTAAARRIVDLSHPITDGLVTYPGIPAPVIGTHLSFDESASHYAAGTEFTIATISMAANTGTYLDTPAHRYRGGDDLAAVPLERMVELDAVVARVDAGSAHVGADGGPTDAAPTDAAPTDAAPINAAIGRPIDEQLLRSALRGADLIGRAVLVHTGHARHWGTPAYFTSHPYLTDDAAEFLVSARPALVGIDSLNIDSTHTGRRPAHTWLLAAGIAIVEHLTALDQLPNSGFRFSAAPPAVRGMGTFTVRAYAVIQ
jgi:arylformamidase